MIPELDLFQWFLVGLGVFLLLKLIGRRARTTKRYGFAVTLGFGGLLAIGAVAAWLSNSWLKNMFPADNSGTAIWMYIVVIVGMLFIIKMGVESNYPQY